MLVSMKSRWVLLLLKGLLEAAEQTRCFGSVLQGLPDSIMFLSGMAAECYSWVWLRFVEEEAGFKRWVGNYVFNIMRFTLKKKQNNLPFSFSLEQSRTVHSSDGVYILGGGAGRGRAGAFDLMTWLDLAGLTPPSFPAGVEGEGLTGSLGCVDRKNKLIDLCHRWLFKVFHRLCVHTSVLFCKLLKYQQRKQTIS